MIIEKKKQLKKSLAKVILKVDLQNVREVLIDNLEGF
jgi:hypothetical protein